MSGKPGGEPAVQGKRSDAVVTDAVMSGSERRAPAHFACMTALTRTGKRDMKNRKPFRSKRLKAVAKRTARKCDDGAFRSAAPVSFH